MSDFVLAQIEKLIQESYERYGAFRSRREAFGVAMEEWSELLDAIRSNDMTLIEMECIDLAAVLIRLARGLHQDDRTAELFERSKK